MTTLDTSGGVITLRVAYYGPPGAGKTTNLQRISALIHGSDSGRITPRRVGENRVAIVEIPVGPLWHVSGLEVVVRLETMQGEVSSVGGGWPGVLSEVDGIVFVANSSPHARTENFKALSAIRERLDGRGRSGTQAPVVMQWNKRDLADARPIPDLETELNHRCFPSIEAAALRGTGVNETLIEILKRAINAARVRAGGTELTKTDVESSITTKIQLLSKTARATSAERFGLTIDRQPSAWVDPSGALAVRERGENPWREEASYSVALGSDTAGRMLAALERAAAALNNPQIFPLPAGLMAGLLGGSGRTHGSLLLFRQPGTRMDECEIVPGGGDPLNALQSIPGETAAAGLCSGQEQLFVEDLAKEGLVDAVAPEMRHFRSALIVPLAVGGNAFGGMIVYVTDAERAPTAEERAYWRTAATLTSVYLAWQAGESRAPGVRRIVPARGAAAEDASASNPRDRL